MKRNPVLVDTSVWIDYFNGILNSATEKLDSLITEYQSICICPTVKQEVLQGFKTDNEYISALRLLNTLEHLDANSWQAAIGAAQIYRQLRKSGITIRKSNDCLIAWYAITTGCSVLHIDRDFDLMTKPLKLIVEKL